MENSPALDINTALAAGLSLFAAPMPLTLNEWANQFFYLSPESSSIEGPWKSLPYQVGPLNWMGNDDIPFVSIKKSSRIGYTKMMCASVCYNHEHRQRNQLIYQPTDGDAQKFTEDEIDPLLVDISVMRNICKSDPTKKSSNNKVDRKKFTGSTLDILGGKSPRNYRRYTKDIVYYDELAAFDPDIGGEGSPTSLGDTRIETSSFPKSIRGSSPKIKGECHIEACLEEADVVMVRFLPCPDCGTMQFLKWGQFDFDSRSYICEYCKNVIGYEQYPDMDAGGQWRSKDGFVRYDEGADMFTDETGSFVEPPHHVGVEIWSAYSYFYTWAELVYDFQKANNELKKTGNRAKLKTFINTKLAETWEERGERVDGKVFDERVEELGERIPNGVLFITIGADVQGGKDARVEYEVVGWGLGDETWSLDYEVIKGDVDIFHVWDHMDDARKKKYTREDGVVLGISCAFIDSGYKSDSVYKYTGPRERQMVFASKGHSSPGRPIIAGAKRQGQNRAMLYTVGTDTAKEILFTRLNKVTEPGPGYCHFPDHYPDEYFDMLTAEEKRQVKDKKTGAKNFRWVKIRDRNEALDCRVYAMAAKERLNPNLRAIKRRTDAAAKRIAERAGENKSKPADQILKKPKPEPEQTAKPKKKKKRRRTSLGPKKGGFIYGWRK